MSFILEALKRADAERARGAVPGLNTPAPEPLDDESPGAPRPWLWMVAGVVVALGAVLAWRWAATSDVPQAPVGVVAQAPAASASPALPPQEPATAAVQPPGVQPAAPAPSVAGSEPSTAMSSSSSAVASTTPVPATAPRSTDGRTEAPSNAAARRGAAAKEAPPRKAPPVVAAAASGARAEPARRVYRQAELPDEIRRALPRISIGGSIYSESAASRMIVINGQVLHEGEKLGPELELHQIRMKEAVLDFRGYRYEVPY